MQRTCFAASPATHATAHSNPHSPPLPLHPPHLPLHAHTGLQHVDMVMSKEQPELNRGFAFAEFYNSACAQLAKSVLSHPDFK